MNSFLLRIIISTFLFSTVHPSELVSQTVLGEERLKKYSTDGFEFYPYDYLDPYGRSMYIMHDPNVKVSAGEFVQLWKPDRGSYRDRLLRKYNILMEMIWETEFELEREEDILHFFMEDTSIVVLTNKSDRSENFHQVLAHKFGLESGEKYETDVWWVVNSENDHGIQFSLTPDGSRILCYYFAHKKENRNVSLYYDYVRSDDQAGYRATAVHRVYFACFDVRGEKVSEGFIEPGNPKLMLLDCQSDQEGNIYLTAFERSKQIQIFQWKAENQQQKSLTYEIGLPLHEFQEAYTSHMPPMIGHSEQVYLAFSERIKKGKKKGTKGFNIVGFDFQKEAIDQSRTLDINSTFQVLVEKQRELFGLKPVPRFDEFIIRGLIEMEDSSLWLITQKYDFHSMAGSRFPGSEVGPADQKMEEIILYEFGPDGKPLQAIVIPTIQHIQSLAERVGQFYDMDIDRKNRVIRLITREPSGERLRGPERIYYRKIDLNSRDISERLLLYEGKRRDQYLLRAFVEWINPAIVSFLMVDGDSGDAYSVAVNVEMKPSEEEEDKKKKKSRK